MKRQLLLFIVLTCATKLFSQVITSFHDTTWNDARAAVGFNGHHIITGSAMPNWPYVMRLNSATGIVWKKQFVSWSHLTDLVSRPADSAFAACGATQVTDVGPVYAGILIKFNSNGDTSWCRRLSLPGYNLVELSCIETTPDSGYIAGGYAITSYTAQVQPLIIRVSKSGVLQWSKLATGLSVGSKINAIRVNTDGSIYILGTYTLNNQKNWIIGRITSLGTISWLYDGGSGSAQDLCVHDTLVTAYVIDSSPQIVQLHTNGSLVQSKLLTSLFGGDNGERQNLVRLADDKFVLSWPRSGSAHAVILRSDLIPNKMIFCYYLSPRVYLSSPSKPWFIFQGYNTTVKTTSTNVPGFSTASIDTITPGGCLQTLTVSYQNQSVTLTPVSVTLSTIGALSAYTPVLRTPEITSYSGCAGAGVGIEKINHPEIRIFPSPADDGLNIEIDESFVGVEYTIYNSMGQAVQQNELKAPEFVIPTQYLPQDIYLLQVKGEATQPVISHRFVVVH